MRIATFAGLDVSAKPSAFGTYFVLATCLAIFGASRLRLRAPAAVGFGIAGVLLHVGSVFVHHLGHALAARLVGYPMSGMRFFGPLASSLYPEHEPELSAAMHVCRAAGGPLLSVLFSYVTFLSRAILASRGPRRALWCYLALDNLVVLGLGSLAPLPFTDGGTFQHYWPALRRGIRVSSRFA